MFCKVSLYDEIVKGNVIVVLIDFGYVVSVVIVICLVLFWVVIEGWYGILIVIVVFVIGSIVMLLIS